MGIPCNQIQQNGQPSASKGCRWKNVLNALFGSNTKHWLRNLTTRFWDRGWCGNDLLRQWRALAQECISIPESWSVMAVILRVVIQRSGQLVPISGEHFINSMPITALINRLDPPPPDDMYAGGQKLNYRDFNRGANRWRYRPISRQLDLYP